MSPQHTGNSIQWIKHVFNLGIICNRHWTQLNFSLYKPVKIFHWDNGRASFSTSCFLTLPCHKEDFYIPYSGHKVVFIHSGKLFLYLPLWVHLFAPLREFICCTEDINLRIFICPTQDIYCRIEDIYLPHWGHLFVPLWTFICLTVNIYLYHCGHLFSHWGHSFIPLWTFIRPTIDVCHLFVPLRIFIWPTEGIYLPHWGHLF